jgi:glycosyltransferase involved in cell wall biosynthesis
VLQRLGVPWVADFRDGWVFESQRPRPAATWLSTFDRILERAAVTRAGSVTAVTEPIAADLRTRFRRPVATVTNGFDPDLEPASAELPEGLLSRGRRSLVHTGNLAYGGRSPEPLLAALHALRSSVPATADRLEVVLIGPISDVERDSITRAELGNLIRLTGPIPHETALAAQRAADGLLLITGPRQTGVATGKLYEYLKAERPILVIGDETAAARIVERTGAGIAVPRDNCPALTDALRRFTEAPEQMPRAAIETLDAFAYPALAAQIADLVEQAIAGRTATQKAPGTPVVGSRYSRTGATSTPCPRSDT